MRAQSMSFSIGSKGYICGGYDGVTFKTDVWEYDPSTNVWTQKTNLPGLGLASGVGFSVAGKGYLCMGQGIANVATYEYDPILNTWATKTSFPTTALSDAVGFSIGSKGYVGAGSQLGVASAEFWEYDPTLDAWTQKTNFGGGARLNATGFSIGTKGYIGTGSNTFAVTQNDFWEYDPTGNTWTAKTNYAGGASEFNTGFSIGNRGYIRENSSAGANDFYEYNPTANTWTAKTDIGNGQRNRATAFSIGNKGYFGTGNFGATYYNDFWEYNPDMTYLWSTTATTNSISVSTAATFTVQITDVTGCVTSLSQAVTVNPFPTVTITGATTICAGSSLVLTGNGASTYTWSTNAGGVTTANASVSPTATTIYTVTGAGPTGCSSIAQATVFVNPQPTVTANATATLICSGASINLTGAGANTYTWSGGVTNNIAFAPTATAVYTVTGQITATGCTNTAQTTISVNITPTVTANATSTAICIGGTVALTGGGAATYTWTSGITDGLAFSPGATASYSVTGQTNGCFGANTAVRTITVDNVPTVNASASQAVICLNTTVTLNATGATNYTWTSGVTNGVAFAPSATTSYTVVGATVGNCTNTAVVSITVNSLPTVTASVTQSVVCSGQTVTLSGGGAVTHTWSNGVMSGVAFTPTVTRTYTLTGTGANSCTNAALQTVSVNLPPTVTANALISVLCNSGATTTLFGGGATTYSWTGGVFDNFPFAPGSTQTYTVRGTDAVTGCTNTAVKTITVFSLPVVTSNITNTAICTSQTISLIGGGAFTYTWTGGVVNGVAFSPSSSGSYTVTGTDINGCVNTTVVTVTLNTLPTVTAGSSNSVICKGASVVLTGGGANTYTWTNGVINATSFSPTLTVTYTVTGFDLNNCSNKALITVIVNNLPIVTALATKTAVCIGGSVTLNGGGAITYTWSNAVPNNTPFAPSITDNYLVAGTDGNGCINSAAITVTVNSLPNVVGAASNSVVCFNYTTTLNGSGALTYTWSSGTANGAVITPTITTTYTVTGTDANGCTNTNTQLILVNPLPPVTASVSDPLICKNDLTTLTGGGANSYTWTGNAMDGIAFSPTITTTFTVTGADISNCANTATVLVTVKPLPTVSAIASPTTICNGDYTTLTGGGAISYTWSGSVTNGVPYFPASTDTYTVTGTGANGCTNTAVRTVSVITLPPISANTTHSVICLNYTTSLSGGGATTYTWTGGVINGAAFSPTITTTYTVTGSNGNACLTTAVITITVNALPVVTGLATNPVVCLNELTTLNGGGALTYTWTNSAVNGVAFAPPVTAIYTVTGADANTCTNTAVVSLTVNPRPSVTAIATSSAICFGNSTTLNGGGAVTYAWASGINNGVAFTPTLTASYTVTGTGANGCTNTAVTTVTVLALPSVTASVSSSVICDGSPATFIGSGANTYTWSNGIINSIPFTPTANATFTVTGTDLNNCVNSATLAVIINTLPIVSGSVTQTVICNGESITLTGAGATSYTWSGGAINGTPFSPSQTTTYTLTGATSGCAGSGNVQITVTVNTLPPILVNSGQICIGNTFTIVPSGALSYTYSSGPVVNPTSTSSYTVFGTSAEGCVNTVPVISNVAVNLLPVINLSSTQNTLCNGISATITANGATTYSWTEGSSNPAIVITPSTTTTYSVTGIDANQCTAGASILIGVVNAPLLTVSASSTSICRGAQIVLTAGGAETYSWSTGSNAASFSDIPINNITYTVVGTSGTVCDVTKVISVTVAPLPLVDAGNNITLQTGETYQLNPSQTGGAIFKWETSEGLSNPNVLNPLVTIDRDITYTLTVTSARGCAAKDEITITVSSGMIIANYMSPNGDGKNDTWKISNINLIKDYSVEIINSWGKIVFNKDRGYENEFDANDLPDGVYYYFIKDGNSVKYNGNITVTR